MHWNQGEVETANWVMIQRCAALSYMTIGSPLLSVSQRPPKPLHNVLPAAGPKVMAPDTLSKTANDEFTHCTYCVAPTAPLVSGGAPDGCRLGMPTPSKPRPVLTPTLGSTANCCTASG